MRLAIPLLLTLAALTAAASAAAGEPAAAERGAVRAAGEGARGAASSPPMRRVVLLGLGTRGKLGRYVRKVSNPSSSRYRRFLKPSGFRSRFSAPPADRRRVLRFLRGQAGVRRVQLSSTRTTALAVLSPAAAQRLFCASDPGVPLSGLCIPPRLRGVVRQVSVGEQYEAGLGPSGSSGAGREPLSANTGTPEGCAEARATGAYLPNQLAAAYGTDRLRDRGLSGRGVRVAILSGQPYRDPGLETWSRCFDLPEPRVESFSMPSANGTTATVSNEQALDIQGLASLAPGLERIMPIFVPLDQNFSHSFPLFMFGVLDRSRQFGRLPDVLSISDGVCEKFFSPDQLRLGERLLREAAAFGITALAAAGDSGFLGCEGGGTGASYPNSSRFVTGVGGTNLSLDAGNRIERQVVWSTFATAGTQAVGTGGGPSARYGRPGYQRAPGIGAELQPGDRSRLTPDLAAMASFEPGIATFNEGQGGWGADGGTSAATPLSAAIVALVSEQERRAGRARLGSLPPLLYELARGPGYGSIFFDITVGTSSRKPNSAVGQTPAAGAAQPGYDLATGLGSLNASAFADAVATAAPRGREPRVEEGPPE